MADEQLPVNEIHRFSKFGFKAKPLRDEGILFEIISLSGVQYDIPFNSDGRRLINAATMPTDAAERKALAKELLNNQLVLPHEVNNGGN